MSLQGNSWKKDYDQRERHHVQNQDQRETHHDDQRTQWTFQRAFWVATAIFSISGLLTTFSVLIGKFA